MKPSTEHALVKVPEVTLGFWIIKIAATKLGETGGDAVSMSMNLGYLLATGIFAAVFLAAVIAQVRAQSLQPLIYWATIVGTTLADVADRSLGIGYAGGSSLLLVLLLGAIFAWHRTLGSVSASTPSAGGLALDRYSAWAALLTFMSLDMLRFRQRAAQAAH